MIAVLDIGSNSIKILVAQKREEGWTAIAQWSLVTQLGGGIQDGMLSTEAMERTLRGISQLLQKTRLIFGNIRIIAGATSAVRDAKNGALFLEKCQAVCKLMQPPEMITAEREAALTFAGAASFFPENSFVLNADIGGRSTEIAWGFSGKPCLYGQSLPLGAVRWREQYHLVDRVSEESVSAALEAAVTGYAPVASRFLAEHPAGKFRFSVSGGTSFMGYCLAQGKIVSFLEKKEVLGVQELEAVLRTICAATDAERVHIPGMLQGRAPVAPAGVILLLGLLKAFGKQELIVNRRGLRWGILAEQKEEK